LKENMVLRVLPVSQAQLDIRDQEAIQVLKARWDLQVHPVLLVHRDQ